MAEHGFEMKTLLVGFMACIMHTVHKNVKAAMQKRMTITIDEDVYEGLFRVVGRGKVSQFLQELARPHVMRNAQLDEGYRAMAADTLYEKEANEWIDGLINGVVDGTNNAVANESR
jgi:predicted CopG family antitoxin